MPSPAQAILATRSGTEYATLDHALTRCAQDVVDDIEQFRRSGLAVTAIGGYPAAPGRRRWLVLAAEQLPGEACDRSDGSRLYHFATIVQVHVEPALEKRALERLPVLPQFGKCSGARSIALAVGKYRLKSGIAVPRVRQRRLQVHRHRANEYRGSHPLGIRSYVSLCQPGSVRHREEVDLLRPESGPYGFQIPGGNRGGVLLQVMRPAQRPDAFPDPVLGYIGASVPASPIDGQCAGADLPVPLWSNSTTSRSLRHCRPSVA